MEGCKMHYFNETQLESILLEAGFLDFDKLEKIRSIQKVTGDKIEKILLSEEIINYRELLALLANKMGVDYIDLENISVEKDALKKVNSEVAKKYLVFPFDIKNNHLFLAMQNPDDIFMIDEIKVFTQMEIKPFLADSRLIAKAISYFYSEETKPISNSKKIEQRESNKNNKSETNNTKNIKSDNSIKTEPLSSTNMEDILKILLKKSMKLNAHEIHIDTINKKTRIRYRANGSLVEGKSLDVNDLINMTNNLKAMAGLDASLCDIPQKGCFFYQINDMDNLNIEVLSLPTVNGEKLLIKTHKVKAEIGIENIGLTDFEREEINELLNKKTGLIFITGQNTNLRTTTFYALLKKVTSSELNIIAIEETVTQNIEEINQIQTKGKDIKAITTLINTITEFSPDMIFVDLANSTEVMELLFEIALNGKKVIATTNFYDISDTLKGLNSLGINADIIAQTFEGVIAQTLVRRLCQECNGKIPDSNGGISTEEGCEMCENTGYRGNQILFEVLNSKESFKELIKKELNIELIKEYIDNSKSSFKANSLRLVNEGLTSIEEISKIGY